MEVEGLTTTNNKDPMAIDNAMSQLAFSNDLNFDLSQNILPQASNNGLNNKGTLLGDNLSPKMVPVEGSSPINKPPSPPTTASGIITNAATTAPGINPRGGTQIPPPAYNTVVPGLGTSNRPAIKSARRRGAKIGLTPKIIIFSDKKDLIRVSLDSDESDDTEDVAHLSYDHRFHVKSKSSRRRSIAGDSVDLSSSRESLAADTEIDEGGGSQKSLLEKTKKQVEKAGKGIANAAFVLDEVEEIEVSKSVAKVSTKKERPKSAKQKNKPSRITISPVLPAESQAPQVATGKEHQEPSLVTGGPGKPKSGKSTTASGEKEMKGSNKGGRPKSARPSASSSSASTKKGGKQSKDKSGGVKKKDGFEEEETPQTRPHTAGIERWSTKEVQNMNELVAWERPEDDI